MDTVCALSSHAKKAGSSPVTPLFSLTTLLLKNLYDRK
jgi:hypothetical protein